MPLNRLKLRFRRNFRLQRKQVEGLSGQVERQVERNFIRRFSSLVAVKRFAISWLLLFVILGGLVVLQINLLTNYYQTSQPIAGGIYTEGILGTYTNANPIYATGQVDNAVSHLIFSGLFKSDDRNRLVGDLATSWSLDSTGKVYTVRLRPNITWQDGQPLTAKDVVFTYHTIQDPDAQSPLNVSWQNVNITSPDSQTVVFTLPNPLSSFPYSLTTGIIPEHILGNTPIYQLRSVAFDTMQPVGSGPFAMQAINVTGLTPDTRQEEVQLKPFANYYGGKPKLNSFIIHSFHNQDQMIRAFNSQELDAMIGLNTLPDNVANESAVQQYDFPLTSENMVFFKTSTGVLSDVNVRQALVTGANIPQVILNLGYSANQVREPLLENQLGYNKAYQQTPYNFNQAAQILTNDGWIVGKDGIRYNKGQRLTFGLYAQDSNEYATVAGILKQQWRKLGVDVQVYLQQDANMQATLAYHAYDALLYGISIGPDPDTFVYWDSTQADVRSNTRLNFAEYKSSIADAALEAGRTRSDPALRAIKYQPFLKAWQQDAPALGLYQPRFLYVTRGKVFNLDQHTINVDTDRYENVQNWMIRQAPQNIVK